MSTRAQEGDASLSLDELLADLACRTGKSRRRRCCIPDRIIFTHLDFRPGWRIDVKHAEGCRQSIERRFLRSEDIAA